MRITELRVNLIQLEGFDSGRIVVHAEESRAGSAEGIGAGLVPTALGQLVVVALYQVLRSCSLPVRASERDTRLVSSGSSPTQVSQARARADHRRKRATHAGFFHQGNI